MNEPMHPPVKSPASAPAHERWRGAACAVTVACLTSGALGLAVFPNAPRMTAGAIRHIVLHIAPANPSADGHQSSYSSDPMKLTAERAALSMALSGVHRTKDFELPVDMHTAISDLICPDKVFPATSAKIGNDTYQIVTSHTWTFDAATRKMIDRSIDVITDQRNVSAAFLGRGSGEVAVTFRVVGTEASVNLSSPNEAPAGMGPAPMTISDETRQRILDNARRIRKLCPEPSR